MRTYNLYLSMFLGEWFVSLHDGFFRRCIDDVSCWTHHWHFLPISRPHYTSVETKIVVDDSQRSCSLTTQQRHTEFFTLRWCGGAQSWRLSLMILKDLALWQHSKGIQSFLRSADVGVPRVSTINAWSLSGDLMHMDETHAISTPYSLYTFFLTHCPR